MGVIIFGVVIFCFGIFCMVQERSNWPALALAIVGLCIAFRGLADFTAHLVIQSLQRDKSPAFDEATQSAEQLTDEIL